VKIQERQRRERGEIEEIERKRRDVEIERYGDQEIER